MAGQQARRTGSLDFSDEGTLKTSETTPPEAGGWMGWATVLIPIAVPGLLGGRRSPTGTWTSGAKTQLNLAWTGKGSV